MVLTLAAVATLAALPGRASDAGRPDDSAPGDDLLSGASVYQRQCARCHQADGSGIEGLYPSLVAAAGRWQSADEAIRTVLGGRVGDLEVDGVHYDNVMPAHGFLANETVAAALTYVLHRWGPEDGPVQPPIEAEDVAGLRLEMLSGHPAATDSAIGVSPLADMGGVQYVTTEGPPLSVEDFERARSLYYGHCTGCHGVLRQGTAGNPLTPELMRERGTEYLRSVISYGSSAGMPNWGTSDSLSAEDIDRLALFLQHPVPQPPDMDAYQVRDSWHQYRIPADRPDSPQHEYDLNSLFVAALHDVGQIAVIDGTSKRLINRIDVGGAPHRITASASGRYLYVISRDGTLTLVDLYAAPPERVASVRIGFEARTVGASRYPGFEDRYVLAGAYWPPQVVLLDGQTLEPLRLLSTRGFSAGDHRYHPEPRVTDVAGSPRHPEFITHIKETGHIYLLPYDESAYQKIHDLETVRELRAGSFSTDGRYYLTPADSNAIAVLDAATRTIEAEIPARVFGGNPGTSYQHPGLGPVWATTTMVGDEIVVVGTDPDKHPDRAWRVLQRVKTPASGSLFVSTHPASKHLWLDTPLTRSEASQTATVFERDDLERGFRTLPVTQWSGLEEGPRRVLQPTFSADGGEVWLAVWNPQDLGSAIVVVDDDRLEPVTVIRDPGLITPTRIYSVAALRSGASVPAEAAATTVAPESGALDGAALYAANCANCHGTYGEGDGPMAPELAVTLQDLRYLAARNDGRFPASFVREIVDGRAMRAAHGPQGMPVWGAELARDAAGPGAAERRIEALVDFLRSIQLQPDR